MRSLRPVTALLAAALLMGAAPYPGHPATTPGITAADILSRDKAISDDAFEGRGPGTKNGEAAAQWIAAELKRIGVKPANRGSYFQKVSTAVIALDGARSRFSFATKEGTLTPAYPDGAVYWTSQYAANTIDVKEAPLVFVGYGVVAPEYGWNDYAGVDVKGKTVVILINDPGNEDASPDPAFFQGKAMTYYGRWTYKFEEAARQGAAAAIIVHETAPAAYGWNVVKTSNSGNKAWLTAKNKNASRAKIEGWMTRDTAEELFKRAGLDYPKLKEAANKKGFKAVAMEGETLSVHAVSAIRLVDTRNVVGYLPGKTHPEDVLIYSAHWDHLGIKPNLPGADKIYNGAVDNGIGVSMVLELAEKFAHDPKLARSIAFSFWTLEEQGLLGSDYFSKNPLWPLGHIVGVVNQDAGLPGGGKAHDMSLSGNGQSELEEALAGVLKAEGRYISADPEPEKGHFFRSDHFPLAKAGVPAITPDTGEDFVAGGKEASKRLRDDYVARRYHQPSDEFDPDWDVSGLVENVETLHTLGVSLANSDVWPNWYKDSAFRAARDKVMAVKK